MITFSVKAESLFSLADILEELVNRIDEHLNSENEVQEVIEYDEDGYYYNEEEDELYWVDFATGEEFYYDEEQDAWLECDETVEFLEEDEEEGSELDIEVDSE
jgi:hypothetical protein